MKCVCFLAALLHVNSCFTQMLRSPLNVSYLQVGAYSKHFSDVFSFTANQASLARIQNTAAGVYSGRKFMLNELKRFSGVLSFPFQKGGAGLTADYSGFKSYNESHIGFAYGRMLGEVFDLGVQFNYYHISMAGYGAAGAVNFDLATIIHVTDELQAGFHIYNPVGGKLGKNSGEKLTSVYSSGLGYEASEKLFITAEVAKEESRPVTVNAALQYAFISQFFLRGGITSAAGSFFAGMAFSWSSFRVDIAADWHPQAGVTPSLLLVFNLTHAKTATE